MPEGTVYCVCFAMNISFTLCFSVILHVKNMHKTVLFFQCIAVLGYVKLQGLEAEKCTTRDTMTAHPKRATRACFALNFSKLLGSWELNPWPCAKQLYRADWGHRASVKWKQRVRNHFLLTFILNFFLAHFLTVRTVYLFFLWSQQIRPLGLTGPAYTCLLRILTTTWKDQLHVPSFVANTLVFKHFDLCHHTLQTNFTILWLHVLSSICSNCCLGEDKSHCWKAGSRETSLH